jgi:hypothetical protein
VVALLTSNRVGTDAALVYECAATLSSFATDRGVALDLLTIAAPALFAHLDAVSCHADPAQPNSASWVQAMAALCRALRVIVSVAGQSQFQRAKVLVEQHVDALTRAIDGGTAASADASRRLRRESAANAALLLARSLTPSHEIVVLTAPAHVDETTADARVLLVPVAPRIEAHDGSDCDGGDSDCTVDECDYYGDRGAEAEAEAGREPEEPRSSSGSNGIGRSKSGVAHDNASVAHVFEIDVDGGVSSVATSAAGAQACECDGCASAFTADLRQTIVRSGLCASLTRLALSGHNACVEAALEALGVVARGCGDRRALGTLATIRVQAGDATRDLASLLSEALHDRQLSDDVRINAMMCFVNIVHPLEVTSSASKLPLVELLTRLLRERPIRTGEQVREDELLPQLLVVERLVAALASLAHDDSAVQRAAVDCQVLPLLGSLCGAVGAHVPALARLRGAVDRRFSSPDLRLGTVLSAVMRATLLALAALCATLEETRRVVASDQRALALLAKALCDGAAPVRAAAAALARSMSRSVRALRTAMADTTISLPLVALLSDPCLKVQRIATAALSNTLLEFSPMKQAAIGGGAVPLLAARFKDAGADAALRLTSSWALRNLLFEAPIAVKRLVVCCVTLAELCTVLRGADAELREQSLGMLRNAMHDDVNALFGLFAAAADGTTASADAGSSGAFARGGGGALTTTTITVAAAASAKWSIDDCRQLMETLALLLRSAEMTARANRHALYVICNAAAGSEPLKTAVVESGVLVDVVSALEQVDTKVGEAALWCLINLTWPSDAGTLRRVELLRGLGCVEKLRVLTTHEDQGVARRAAALLAALASC